MQSSAIQPCVRAYLPEQMQLPVAPEELVDRVNSLAHITRDSTQRLYLLELSSRLEQSNESFPPAPYHLPLDALMSPAAMMRWGKDYYRRQQ